MQQGTREWFEARAGRVTASRIGDLMSRTKTGWGAARKHYFDEIVAERITGQPIIKRMPFLDFRLEREPEARAAYAFYSDNEVEVVGFIEHPSIANSGCSPDGLVGSTGGLELKCCDTTTHIEIITAGFIDPDYIEQINFCMACTDREWWDFASYDPLMPEELKLYVQRVPRDEKLIIEIETCVIDFLLEVDEKVKQVRSLIRGSTPLLTALESSLESLGVAHVI